MCKAINRDKVYIPTFRFPWIVRERNLQSTGWIQIRTSLQATLEELCRFPITPHFLKITHTALGERYLSRFTRCLSINTKRPLLLSFFPLPLSLPLFPSLARSLSRSLALSLSALSLYSHRDKPGHSRRYTRRQGARSCDGHDMDMLWTCDGLGKTGLLGPGLAYVSMWRIWTDKASREHSKGRWGWVPSFCKTFLNISNITINRGGYSSRTCTVRRKQYILCQIYDFFPNRRHAASECLIATWANLLGVFS